MSTQLCTFLDEQCPVAVFSPAVLLSVHRAERAVRGNPGSGLGERPQLPRQQILPLGDEASGLEKQKRPERLVIGLTKARLWQFAAQHTLRGGRLSCVRIGYRVQLLAGRALSRQFWASWTRRFAERLL